MSTEQSAASQTEVGPVETATVGPDQTAVPSHSLFAYMRQLLTAHARGDPLPTLT
ncbi:MAG TPA: hypothetical protein VG147_02840 [Solirubrobacteraceae bacterium]|jgi:hypothetical protein|nr:hypothetical protein [Solirubrobacteraceae bacterium]